MIKKLLIIAAILLWVAAGFVFAQENNIAFQERTNSETERRLLRLEGGVSLTAGVTGVLPLANGGTGSALTDPGADRVGFWDDSEGTFTWLTAGTGLLITTTTITSPEANESNVLFEWHGVDERNDAANGWYQGTDASEGANSSNIYYSYLYTDTAAYSDMLYSKFIKLSGISTITINARLWADEVDAISYIQASVGGQTGAVSRTNQTPGWATADTIDVSGLTNGETYDIIISNKSSSNASSVFCSSIVLTGS